MTGSLSAIPAVLARYPAEIAGTPSLTPAKGGFSGAGVWRIESRAGSFALRAWPSNGIPEARIHGLHRLLKHLAGAGIKTVAVPRPARNGATLVSSDGRLWQLEPWMPGSADFHRNPSRARLASAMCALADWHRAAATWAPEPAEDSWFVSETSAVSPAVHSRCREIHEWMAGSLDRLKHRVVASLTETPIESPLAIASHSGKLWTPCSTDHHARIGARLPALALQIIADFARAAPRVRDELERLSTVRFRLQPCLRDIWHDHVLWTGDDVTGLIDPSAARSESVAADLARLLGSLVGDDADAWLAGFNAYRQAAEFSDREWELCRALDRSGVLLSPMTWLNRRYFAGRNLEAEPEVIERLEAQARRLRALAEGSAGSHPL
ncbi:MAG: phosphotransferase [Planctomycetaceae bacterium]|nr:phosphotransferase [Planctomycetaceae bacterium]